MTEWKKMCCALDFSEPSRIAMLQASELARRFEGELTVVHVHAPPPALGTDMLVTPGELGELETIELERTISLWRDEAGRVSGRPVRSAVLVGEPAAEVVRFVREHGIDVLVIGTHGRRGLSRLFLGSVAERIVRAAPCAVLVARRQEGGARERGEGA
jgi:nucleotide-binding universal stress UspA family protein